MVPNYSKEDLERLNMTTIARKPETHGQSKKDLDFIERATRMHAECDKLRTRLLAEGHSEPFVRGVVTMWRAVHGPKHNSFDTHTLIDNDACAAILEKLQRKK